MPYLIDGHNLIPKLGLRLEAADDELELIAILQEYCRRSRRGVEVYFDGAPAGHAGSRTFGKVTAYFVSRQSSADAAIITRLSALGRAARNWTVVSSDREILGAASAAGAGTETSERFAARLRREQQPQTNRHRADLARCDADISAEELRHWLDVFRKR